MIKKPEDLRGKKLSCQSLRLQLRLRHGTSPSRWYLSRMSTWRSCRSPGGQPARMAAIQTKQVHGMVAQPPVTSMARKFNLNIIAEPEDFGGAYPTTPVASRVSYIRERRDTLRKFTRALLEGIYVYKTDKNFSKKVISKYVKTDDNDASGGQLPVLFPPGAAETLPFPRRRQGSPCRAQRVKDPKVRSGKAGLRFRRHERYQRISMTAG